ncbi:MAG: hypothetical protein ACON5O_05615 [Lentimonas sp.]
MKKQTTIAAAILAASSFSFAEIALTENLSVSGFVDTSYTDSDAANASFDLDEVEISFAFEAGAADAQVDIDSDGGDLDLDQAFISYDIAGGTLTAGRFDAQLGLEAFEAPGLYTNSFAYGASQLPGTDEGVKFALDLDEATSFGIALVDAVNADGFLGDEGANETVVELALSRDLGNGLGAFVGYRDNGADDLVNVYVTYEMGEWLFAAELADGVGTDYQLLANYAYADNASVTVRYTTEEQAGGDLDQLTLAHNLALSDSLRLTTELTDNGAVDDEYEFAVSLLFTF